MRTTTRTRLGILLAAGALAAFTAGCSSSGSGSSSAAAGTSPTASSSAVAATTTIITSPASEMAKLKGKRVLVVPYWLDAFGTAFGSWIERYYQQFGVSVTLFNANADDSSQLNELDTAIASGQYAGVIWQPIDLTAAGTTIRAIQQAKIADVVFNGELTPGAQGVDVPQVVFDEQASLYPAGVQAGQYFKAHPQLGTPLVAWLGSYPTTTDCNTRLQGLMAGLKSVEPQAQLVFDQGGAAASDSQRKVADLITSGKKFNIFDGCGSTQSLAGYAALQAAGLAKAVNKVPQKVFIMSQDASPPELQLLWDPTSAMMISDLNPPKDAAAESVNLLNQQIIGNVTLTSAAIWKVGFTVIGNDCPQYRGVVAAQYQGVQGFSVPACPA
jgi:ABC-type sugar transport system substrate-binding protein